MKAVISSRPTPAIAQFTAPAHWHTVDFISDLHLHAEAPQTFAAWKHFMETTPASALFILGDLFDAWVGDDVLVNAQPAEGHSFESQCVQVLGETALRAQTFFMHGNRDFLAGQALMARCNLTLLSDPTALEFPAGSGRHWLLSHGDALCIDDIDYMKFRQQVRSAQWQTDFLSRSLADRKAIARGLREQSEAKKGSGADCPDVDHATAARWLQAANASTLIHGHTHKPGLHDLNAGPPVLRRVVLSDWDTDSAPPRAQVLRLTADGLQRINLV